MYTFAIQSKNNIPMFDFCFELARSIDFLKSMGDFSYDYFFTDSTPEQKEKLIPVGSLQFVFSYLNKENLKAINIPEELLDPMHTGRKVYYEQVKNLSIDKPLFVKESTYKGFTDIVSNISQIPNGLDIEQSVLVSEVVDFASEYRVFILDNFILDMKHYLGDPFIVPNKEKIKQMIKCYTKDKPTAFTLDIGVTNEGNTVIIEVHPFVSIGLYGYSNPRYLPILFIRGFSFLKNQE